MSNGSWENIYVNQGRVQIDVLDSVVDAVEVFNKKGYKDVLDLGCGTGRHTYFMADRGFNVHACDISDARLKITKELIQEAGLENVEYSIQDMYSLTFKDNLYDAILCIWVQGHGIKEEVEKGIKELYRVLKEGGTVITDFVTIEDSTYGIGTEIAPKTFVGGRPGEENIPHYYTTREELEIMFKNFAEVELRDKVYRFNDKEGIEHRIIAIVVEAQK